MIVSTVRGFETIGIAAHHEAQIGQQALRKNEL